MISSFQNNLVVSRLPITRGKIEMSEIGKWYLIYGDGKHTHAAECGGSSRDHCSSLVSWVCTG